MHPRSVPPPPPVRIAAASVSDLHLMRAWADAEGWNPGVADAQPFFAADPGGFLLARREGDDTPTSCVSVIRYGTDHAFLGLYLTRPELRGQGYGIQVWNAGMERLKGRNVGLDGVVAQQPNYRKSGFTSAWTNTRYEGVPQDGTPALPGDVTVVDATTLPFTELAAYDRRFFPAPRDAFLASWLTAPHRTAVAAIRDGNLAGLAVLRTCTAASRIGPLYAETPDIAATLLTTLAATTPGVPIALDAPDCNPAAIRLAERLALTPTFETARMYTAEPPDIDRTGLYAITTLELG
ncbi:GNAT family N-acetyltransferase [Streptomyces sp. NPDC021093]|uniref:GNAT family N-acetyltransferase n=1 Tax=Streptomyces sp. NPDC021093 TaxID=3365112 RepID=UPI0037AD6877